MKESHLNPWTTHSSRKVYSNPWITIREDQVTTPSGDAGIYGVVETRPAIGVIPITPELDTYLVGQFRYPLKNYSWEIIEGGGEKGEDPIEGAKRELLEEAGIIAKNWTKLGEEVHLSNSHSDEQAWFFLAEDLSYSTPNPDSTELLEIKKLPLKEAVQMAKTGEIKDAMSIIALVRLEAYLKQQANR
jgi:NTP pyrophosphohydrolases including oxidative damage repair enzymes